MNKAIRSVFKNMLVQNPNEELISASNKLDRKYKEENHKKYICLFNDSNCKNKDIPNNHAINSHSIQKKHLNYMSENKKVYRLMKDKQNPFKMNLHDPHVKHTLTFPGYCSYHDNTIFKSIENGKVSKYENNDVFLHTYRTLSKYYCELVEDMNYTAWLLENWNSIEHKELIYEMIQHELADFIWFDYKENSFLSRQLLRLKVVKEAFYFFINRKSECRKLFKELQKEKIRVHAIVQKYTNAIKNDQVLDMKFSIFKNKKQIAFSGAFGINTKNTDKYFYMTILPTKNGSDIIISCEEADYSELCKFEVFNEVFNCNVGTINKILTKLRDQIAHSTINFDTDFADRFFLEFDNPILETFPIEYIKLDIN